MSGKDYKDPTPLVSVLMPCYNHEAYVIQSLESVASSDYKCIELIFIDDASKDNSFDLAMRWLEENKNRFVRTVCIQHKKNLGICRTFNELYEHAHGEYVSYLASDDLLLESAISSQVNFAETRAVDFVFSDCQLIDELGHLVTNSALHYFGKSGQKLQKKTCLTIDVILFWEAPWNKFFMKSSFFKSLGRFDESLSFEDRDFIIRVLINGSFSLMPEPTTAYRIRLKNRATPGLSREMAGRDYHRADGKNYLNSYGLTKLLLGIAVYSDREKYAALGITNKAFIFFSTKMFALLRELILIVHRALVH